MCRHCGDKRLKIYNISHMILSKVSTKLNEGNNLPYQETQIFKDVMCEFRKKVSETERPLISLFQRVDKRKEIKQLFPPTNEKDRRGIMSTSKCNKAVNRLKVKLKFNQISKKKEIIRNYDI